MLKLIAALLATFTFTVSAYAGQVVELGETRYGDDTILVNGSFDEGFADELKEMMEETGYKTVLFVSGGGLAREGMDMAQVMSDMGGKSIVPEGYMCLSACALAFVGGHEYIVDGSIGFHQAYIKDEVMETIERGNLVRSGQMASTQAMVHLVQHGFNFDLPIMISFYTNKNVFIMFHCEEDLMTMFSRSDTNRVEEYMGTGINYSSEWLSDHLLDIREHQTWTDKEKYCNVPEL